MFPDGICRVTDSYYTKTIQFQDINYQLDVYKRQLDYRNVGNDGNRQRQEHWGNQVVFKPAERGLQAVSYTHLYNEINNKLDLNNGRDAYVMVY